MAWKVLIRSTFALSLAIFLISGCTTTRNKLFLEAALVEVRRNNNKLNLLEDKYR